MRLKTIDKDKTMKMILIICLWVLLIPIKIMANEEPKEHAFTINAYFTPNSSFQGNWKVIIKAFEDLSGAEIDFSRGNPINATSFTGSAILNLEQLQELILNVDDQAYFELPSNIHPEFIGFDMPHYRLEICRQKNCHKVGLYNPNSMNNRHEYNRFKIIWDLVMKTVPKWPPDWPLIPEKAVQ